MYLARGRYSFYFLFFLLLSSNVFRHKINGGPLDPNPKSPIL